MTYPEFVDSLSYGFSLFIDTLIRVSNVLMHNYIFITLVGLSIFISLFYLIYYFIHDVIDSRIYNIEDKLNRKKIYELYKEIRNEYLDEHRTDEFMYLYNYYILKQQVMNGILQNHSEVLLDNYKMQLDLKKNALKELKQSYENDDDVSNDNDINYLIPNPKVVSFDEFKQSQLKELHESLKKSNNEKIDEISNDFVKHIKESYDLYDDLQLVNKKTGEVINRYINENDNSKFDLFTGEVISNDEFINKINSNGGV